MQDSSKEKTLELKNSESCERVSRIELIFMKEESDV